jgi:predicted nucleotidyltransferase
VPRLRSAPSGPSRCIGSTARGEAKPDSDIDLLYDVAPGARLGWELVDLIDELAVLFGRPVDLVSRRSVHPLIREAVLSEAKEIHAA